MKYFILSLGCTKNQADSEVIMGILESKGYVRSLNPEESDLLIVNTCGFIAAAIEESIEEILNLVHLKKPGQKILVAGCLVQREGKELAKHLPEVDLFFTPREINNLDKLLADLGENNKLVLSEPGFLNLEKKPRAKSNEVYRYIKIADGCDNRCTYCTIPAIRGKYTSRPLDDILEEIKDTLKQGIKEIILVAQDTTAYGIDLYGEFKLVELLRKIGSIKGNFWVRLMYLYPDKITPELINEIKENPKVIKYVDVPLQHIHPEILKKMGRKGSSEEIISTLERLRKEIPDITIRTTFIVGFPGETEEQFNYLLDFVKKFKFNRLGAFPYYREKGTPAAKMKGQIPKKVKEQRYEKLMEVQQEISLNLNKALVGKKIPVIVEKKIRGENLYLGRTYMDAPEIDGIIEIKAEKRLKKGQIINVLITDYDIYDLKGEFIND
ncbi:30S ribosomal protein S12 methylthiotransferase RimO [Carboxydothermus hydrogenoformans]|uniref:Ribosomal protein uS12 methylthiotransferase RimO n=1 Tax=Carboxydothermus hydrogenoformans (strain ATCC BAA-161 / DSM 6008 / Z-2901) TaxID=246194 RepID=RIMO_CARHZ|nr:30S ribosomal protein S12 methylthiotransferase RimO [Carboxydothermus hydrogenoformans]Q3ACX5.1 RecName: Full=Ribosomal protein uS12 methylthiotransferase RimO; Short=uS12 MTTase; Short=uS12 methylthiotransferase; AltName: Full=Ribosomal protein uS12 (aspartate-C(3))-methylthiotransferase; AltName: Full=Ribosome maturation factor RimO [Carboxydothermus hydrogenoformans Z-2901]ABB14537.1 MiaB-like tRNA modifying enzyme YliG, TIGR01125 [Carboxydothermus hydrogenoformans Z-2901]